jgi:basic amino acid/polyamine antiporter, APA family
LALIITLGPFSVLFVLAVVLAASVWYRVYVHPRVPQRAALFGVFRRLGEQHDDGVDEELWGILQERGVDTDDPFDQLLARAIVLDIEGKVTLDEILRRVAIRVRGRLEQPMHDLDDALSAAAARAVVPDGAPAVVHDLLRHDLTRPLIVLVRARRGVRISSGRRFPGSTRPQDTGAQGPRTQALLFLLSPEGRLTEHLRRLAQLVTAVEAESFEDQWRRAHDEQALLEALLRDERYAAVTVGAPGAPAAFADRRLRELSLPGNLLVALVRRGDRTIVPDGDTMLRPGDRLTVIGTPAEVTELCGPPSEAGPS